MAGNADSTLATVDLPLGDVDTTPAVNGEIALGVDLAAYVGFAVFDAVVACIANAGFMFLLGEGADGAVLQVEVDLLGADQG